MKKRFSQLLAGLAVAVLAFFATVPGAKADDWNDCNRRIAIAKWELREVIEDRGYNSREAKHWRHELHEAYERQEHLRRKYRHEQWRNRGWHDRRDYDGYYGDHNRWYEDRYDRRSYDYDRDDDY